MSPRAVRVTTHSRTGSGIYLTPALVLTCQHVICESDHPMVDGVACRRIVADDNTADLALLEVDPKPGIIEPEWTDDISIDATLLLEGYPDGEYRQIEARTRATQSSVNGLAEIEIPANAREGFSGGPAFLKSDPLACCGLVVAGDSPVYSVVIGAGTIRAFLAAHGHSLKMRRTAADHDIAEYLRLLRQETGFIDIRALRIVEKQGATNLPIEELYIPLSGRLASANEKPRKNQDDFTAMFREPDGKPLEGALTHPCVLIQGEAGSGKSTFLKRTAYDLATQAATAYDPTLRPASFPKPLPVSGLFPLFAKIAEIEKHIRQCDAKHIENTPSLDTDPDWLPNCLAAKYKLPAAFFRQRLRSHGAIVLLDGLDESPTYQARVRTMHWIEGLATAYPHSRFAVTTRPRAGSALTGFAQAEIAPLTKEAREKFVDDWTRVLFRDKAPDAAAQQRDKLLGALSSRPEIDRLAQNPLMLTALAALHWNRDSKLPEERAELYEAILVWLAESRPRENERDERVRAADCLEYFGKLAFAMQSSPDGRQERMEIGDAVDCLGMKKDAAQTFLNREEVDSGIIIRDGNAVKFWHLTFQEHLAARHLINYLGEREQEDEIFTGIRRYQAEWREVMRLYAGILAKQSKRKVGLLVGKLLERVDGSLVDRARCAALLSGIQADLQPGGYRIGDDRYPKLLESLRDLFHCVDPNDQPESRVRAAAAAAMLDVFPHPYLRLPSQDDYWVSIPAGTFRMGAQKKHPNRPDYDPQADDDETPRDETVAGFKIGRYPVTVFEYAKYVEATGKAHDAWNHQRNHPSHPVRWVTWHEATAYAKWAGSRLPSEVEWEYAARGQKSRLYPWGGTPPSEHHANHGMNVGEVTPVGLFALSNTPEGVSDMAGNVWEWTATDYDKERGSKSVRGGSFGNFASWLRAANRYRLVPDLRDSDLGFRLVRE